MWRPYYRKWECATLAKLDPALLELVPELATYAQSAHVFDNRSNQPFRRADCILSA
jgi:hypothetical protein